MLGGEELTDPARYSAVWTVVAIVLPLLAVAWYAGVTWLFRDRSVSHAPAKFQLWRARRAHLRELDRIRAAQERGELSTRRAHQSVSRTVRSFVSEVGDVDARAMNLAQLQASGVPQVAAVVELVYPPAFGPAERGDDDERLDTALTDARELVTAWPGGEPAGRKTRR
jgi:hypothetical protein